MKFFFDTETTGLNPHTSSILTLAGVIMTDDLEFVEKIYIETQPAKTIIFDKDLMTALNVNKLNPLEIFNKKSAQESFEDLRLLLSRYGSEFKKLTPVGHNVKFDLNMLESDLAALNKSDIMNYLHYHNEDTMILAQIIRGMGVPMSNCKLETLFKKFSSKFDHDWQNSLHKQLNLSDAASAHNSMYDIYMTICLYKYFKSNLKWVG